MVLSLCFDYIKSANAPTSMVYILSRFTIIQCNIFQSEWLNILDNRNFNLSMALVHCSIYYFDCSDCHFFKYNNF